MNATLIKQSFRSIFHNPVRSGLTVLGIVIGIAAVISLMGLSNGLKSQVTSNISNLDANRVTVSTTDPNRPTAEREGSDSGGRPGGPPGGMGGFSFNNQDPTLTVANYNTLRGLDAVAAASPRGQQQVDVTKTKNATKATGFDLLGVSTDYAKMSSLSIANGTWLTDNSAKSVVLGSKAAEDLFSSSSAAVGKTVYLKDTAYKVVGVLAEVEGRAGGAIGPGGMVNNQLFTGFNSWLTLTDSTAFSTILLDAASEDQVDQVVSEAQTALDTSHSKADFEITTNAQVLSTIADVSGGFTTALIGIAAISLLVGGIGIMNVMLMSVTERTREIGLRRAVGAKRRSITSQFVLESVLLTLIGGVVGVALGYLLAGSLGSLIPQAGGPGRGPGGFGASQVAAVIDLQTVGLAVLVSVVLGLVFGIVPAVRASRLDPARALRYE